MEKTPFVKTFSPLTSLIYIAFIWDNSIQFARASKWHRIVFGLARKLFHFQIKLRSGQFTVSIAVLGYCCVDSLIVVRNFDKKLDFRGYMDGGYKKSPTEYHFGSTHLWRWSVFNGAMGRGCRFQIPGLRSDVHQLVFRWMKLEMIMGYGDDRKDQG